MNIWENIKNRLSVDEVIGSYIPIQSNGANYKCVCPFHQDKTPSLIISPQKQIWHCFGCGVGGDIFKFVEEYEHISKQEVLQILAKKAGVELEKNISQKSDPARVNLNEIGLKYLEWAASTYHKVLLKLLQDKNNRITQYCLSRGLTLEIINQFEIGYAPTGNFLLQLGQKHQLDSKALLDTGLLKQEEGKNIKDKFTDRLVLPIWNKAGQVVGFTGRSVPPDKVERPKYLNSPQTDWFNKSQIWYGWHLARTHILQEKKAIIVEGNMDVVASFSAGFKFTMASQGTSFSETQVKMLSSITKTIWLAFDNDEAGKLSGDKFFKMSSLQGLQVLKVLIPSQFKDLDEYLKSWPNPENNLEASGANRSINSSSITSGQNKLETQNYLDYSISQKEHALTSSNPDLQKQALLQILDLISALDEISREQYLLKLNKLTLLSVASLSTQLKIAIASNLNYSNTDQNFDDRNTDLDKSIAHNRLEQKQNTAKNNKTDLIAWQNLVALCMTQNYGKGFHSLFFLIKQMFPDEIIEANLEEYIIRNQDELQLVLENINKENVSINRLAEMVNSAIEKQNFFQNKELQDYYLTWKQKGVG